MTSSSTPLTILIAEDNRDICDLYATTFKNAGFAVETAYDGKTAIEKWRTVNPDLVLLDIMMPGANGYQVLKAVRKDLKKYTPVIMLTNLDSSHFEQNASFEDIDAYFVKSNYTPAQILEKTKEVLRINKLL